MQVGETVGHYRVVARLGRGGQADVWLAEHPVVGKRVAVKVIGAERAARGAAAERFLAEARAVAGIAHPNVVQLYDFGSTAAGELYFTMEPLDGRSLAEALDGGKLPVGRALAIAAQVADGLGAAHARAVVHRDLKPENVFLLDDGRVKVLDFGLARRADAANTAEGARIGTPEYMAPEQCAARRDLDGRADVYALGCLLHEMLTGRPPFSGDAEAVMRAHREEAPRLDGVPLAPVLARMLAKEPAARFPNMAAVRDALTEVNAVPTVEMAPPAPRRRWRVAALVVAAALVAAAAAPVVTLARRRAPKATPLARTLVIRSTPPGARVTVDGVWQGATPLELTLDATARGDVALELAGYAPWRGAIDPSRGAVVEAVLTPLPPPPEKLRAPPPRRAPRLQSVPTPPAPAPDEDAVLPPSLD